MKNISANLDNKSILITGGTGSFGKKFTQVILEFYTQGISDSGWVHVSYDENNLKCEVLTAVKQDGKTIYMKGLHK